MRVVFFGTPEFAVPTLKRLIDSKHEVVGVVTQPDKPAGRGRKVASPPVKILAEEHGLRVLQPKTLKTNEAAEQIAALEPDVAVVVAYGKIFPKRLLDIPAHGCLNIHGSLLPKLRGAAPVHWAIIHGERTTGVTIMQMDEGMDTGPMIAKRSMEILEDDDATSVGNMLSLMGAELMVEVLAELEHHGHLHLEPQDEAAATYAPLIEREMAQLDWNMDFEKVIWAIRGFKPWPKAYTTISKKEVKITGAEAVDPNWVPKTAFDERIEAGTVIDIFKGRGFVVRTGGDQGVVLITKVQPEGKPEMGAFDFVNGGGLDVGTKLGR